MLHLQNMHAVTGPEGAGTLLPYHRYWAQLPHELPVSSQAGAPSPTVPESDVAMGISIEYHM